MNYKQKLSFNQRSAATGADGRKSAVAGAALGIVTRTTSPLFEIVSDDGEIHTFEQTKSGSLKPLYNPQQVRALRWQMKSVVNRLLPESRTSKCHLFRAPLASGGLSGIEVHVTSENNRAFYTGLMSCGSVWNCPVCLAKIAERRRLEMQEALRAAEALEYKPFLITLTNSHGVGDDLFEMKEKQALALKKMSNGKNSIKNTLYREGIDQVGFIRSYEVTHGNKNGWHPHFHMIVFISSGRSIERLTEELRYFYFKRWHAACKKVGLPLPSEKHGVDVKNGSFAGKYVAKWGLADEMTKAISKRNKKDGVSPWGLLKAIFDNDNPDYPRDYATGLFYTYSRAMSGSRQLYWSNGLRSLLGLSKELDDETVANLVTDEANTHLSTISFERWKQIRRSRSEAQVLEIAETQPFALNQFLSKFDNEHLDKDLADPVRLNIQLREFDYKEAIKGFITKSAKNKPYIPKLLTIAQKQRLGNLIIPMENPLNAGLVVEIPHRFRGVLLSNRK